MNKRIFLTALICTLSFAAVPISYAQVDDTEEGFFESDESFEETPTLSGQLSDEESAELDQEPVPEIRRNPEPFNPRIGKPRKIRHPLAEKGLIRITKDKTYIYKTETSEQNHAIGVRFGIFAPENLENTDTGATFDDNYPGSESPMLLIDYEWNLFKTSLGKLGFKLGSGLYFANGHGRFKNPEYDENEGKTPKEVFTFLAFPNSLGLSYRAQFWDRQLFIPYAEGGVIGWAFTEFRDDGGTPRFGVSPAAFGAAGLGINLTSFDSLAAFDLDHEYGINSVLLTIEYRNVATLGGKFDFSSDMINGGFLMEF